MGLKDYFSRMFNVRVYGLLINNESVLVSDETVKGMEMTKFPGGGLEFGEGTVDCLRRELREEIGIEVQDIRHFYTTDYFVQSAFNPNDQVISIYYLAKAADVTALNAKIWEKENGRETFRWMALQDLSPEMFTFPIDKKVAEMLQSRYNAGVVYF